MPPKGKDKGQKVSAGQPTPSFDPATLQSLTRKIEAGFKKKDDGAAKGGAQKKGKKQESKKQLDGEKPSDAKDNGNGQLKKKQQPDRQTAKKPQGKKRLRNGEVKESRSAPEHRANGKREGLRKKTNGNAANIKLDLRAEIKELGGSDNDYNLIAGVDSASEFEEESNNKAADGKFTKDLKKFIKGLGVEKVRKEADVESSEAEELDEDHERGKPAHTNGTSVSSARMKDQIEKNKKATVKSPVRLILQPQSDWHAIELPSPSVASEDSKPVSKDLIDRLHIHAKTLLEQENQAFADSQKSASSSHQFYSTIMSTGTLSDKISALTLSVQESPIHNMKALESLIGLARKRSRAQAVDVLGALKDLFGPGNLLPSDRKLHNFESNPALHAMLAMSNRKWTDGDPIPQPLTELHLVVWAFEDWLKSIFFQMLQILEKWCSDEVVFARSKSVDYVYSLLKEKPEQEANLLRLLVNKLGDSEKKVSSATSFHILQLETTHPFMKPIIISAIESDLLFRPGQSLHARYYAIITLNQTVLSNKEENVAKKLIDIYFALFLKLLNDPLEPVTKAREAKIANTVKLNKKGEVQGGGGAPGKNAMKKAAQDVKSTAAMQELREKMLSAVLTGVNRAIPYTNTNDVSFEKHLDTLFRITHSSNFNTSIQALMLIQQLQSSTQSHTDRFYRTLYESLLDPRLLTSSKQALYLNLLYRSLRSDLDIKRIKAFAKRILQVVCMHQPSFTCGAIYLLRELESIFPALSIFASQSEASPDDEEEVFHDVPDSPSATSPATPTASKFSKFSPPPKLALNVYDGRKRDPLHANASDSTLWELDPLVRHYHPSVSLFASRLLTKDSLPPKPDLGLNTLIHFLDRFVYKNPKAAKETTALKGTSIMQPLAGGDKGAILVSSRSAGNAGAAGSAPFTDASFWKKGADDVRADEVFFHRYVSAVGSKKERQRDKKARKEEKKRKSDQDDDDDDEEAEEELAGSDGESEDNEEEIWKALVGSRPEVEGDDVDEEGFSDVEDYSEDDAAEGNVDIDGDEVDGGSEDNLGFEDEEDGALFDSEEEVPGGLDEAAVMRMQGIGAVGKELKGGKEEQDGKRKADGGQEDSKGRKKRKWLKDLPTFASVEEYEKVLGGDEEEG